MTSPRERTVHGEEGVRLSSQCDATVPERRGARLCALTRPTPPPRRFGPYELEALIGAGGMGIVYRARDTRDASPVAIKMLPSMLSDHRSRERFAREVMHMARLEHPNIVRVLDHGTSPEGLPYYVMEHLRGIDAGALVRENGPLPPARVAHLLRQAADALGEAHAKGIVHRDVTPTNLLTCAYEGRFDVLKVIDFGLVKDLELSAALTLDGMVLGTPGYLPPESFWTPPRVDARSDVYMLAGVGYYMLTATRPFGDLDLTTEERGRRSPPPPSRRVAHRIPADLEAVLMSALHPVPGWRPSDGRAFAAAIAACAGDWTQEQARASWID